MRNSAGGARPERSLSARGGHGRIMQQKRAQAPARGVAHLVDAVAALPEKRRYREINERSIRRSAHRQQPVHDHDAIHRCPPHPRANVAAVVHGVVPRAIYEGTDRVAEFVIGRAGVQARADACKSGGRVATRLRITIVRLVLNRASRLSEARNDARGWA